MPVSRGARFQGPLLALSAVVVVLLLAEIALRVLAPVSAGVGPQHINAANPYIRFEYPRHYSAVTETEPGLPGLSGVHAFTTNNMGFRGDSLRVPGPADEYRVFLVGGSTVECFYLDDDDEIGRVLQREMQATAPSGTTVRVYNAGLSGTATDDHIAMIAQRIAHLEPDLVVVMCGINDLTRSIYGYDYLHFTPPAPPGRPWYKRWAMQSQIVRRVHFARQRISPDPERLQQQRPLRSNYAALVGLQRTGRESAASPRVDATSYANNLRTLAGIARGHGFAMVFVTQQTTWNSPDPGAAERHWMRYRDGEVYREDRMAAAMDSLNGAMRAVGSGTGVPVYDLARELPGTLENFYDDCHFNVAGAAAAGRGLAAFLRARGLPPGAAGVVAPDGGTE